MRLIFTSFFVLLMLTTQSQLLTTSPEFVRESSTSVEIIVDASKGNQGLKDHLPTSDVYVHLGVITNFSSNPGDWQHANNFNWGTTNPLANCVYLGNNRWKYTITGSIRSFFNITNPAEVVYKIAILFRNGNGSRVQRNSDGSDMYIPVSDNSLQVRITDPPREPRYVAVPEPINKAVGEQLPVTAKSSENADLRIYYNGTEIASAANTAVLSASATIVAGNQQIIAEARSGSITRYDTLLFFVAPAPVIATLPAGVKDGINYEPGDTSATIVLFAPGKSRIAVLGDFNNWTETLQEQMNKTPDGNRFWIRLKGLTPGLEYAYQYFVDGNLRVADYNAEKVLDPANDPFIPATNYPALKPYPTGKTNGIVSVLQTNKPLYNWQANNFIKPDKRNLIIYEMLVRDFVAAQNWQTVTDTLTYLKRLGINAIEIMPFNEFEGNNSWGYNSSFFFAPDKMYGPENALRRFVDECHKQGIAVIMDIAMNHAYGQSPTVQLYFNSQLNRPAGNNPWHNQTATHPFNVGYDFNHESQATKELVDRVIEHWLTKYRIDGFRWDLSKGFTQRNSCVTANCESDAEVGNWSAYDAGRIATWKRIYDKMQTTAANAYCILEHFAANNEEIELSNYGMLLWGNANYNFNEATMGYVGTSNFEGAIYKQRGWSQPNLITYQESHDEERLMVKNLAFGNSSNPAHNVKDLNTALNRNGMAAAFWAMIPAPKMLWQFGELGYDYSINYCQDGSINNNCRTNPKPIRWDYQQNANRRALYDVYSKLLSLRNVPNFLPTFVTNDISWNLNGGFKTLQVNSDSLKICVIGNFDVVTTTGTVTFQQPGTWYNYLSGGTRAATGNPETITLQPGEYYVYTNRNANPFVTALPVKLVSFTTNLKPGAVDVTWITTNEDQLRSFEVERSLNGTDFRQIENRAAAGSLTSRTSYIFSDREAIALNVGSDLYYRLKMVDMDGQFSYSAICRVPAAKRKGFTIYPNPATTILYIRFDQQNVSEPKLTITDLTGRKYRTITTTNAPMSNGTLAVPLGKMAKGSYLLKLETRKGEVFIKQFSVQQN
ncbi:alpha-amylase family glycosyl hydrolase [Segetibacter sp. 3557_3]|uniref:alpha-amylase family glycosyl hydrolase n=1 Tax=Segetibacter sp. 3557_3 TaxID=2547429 RepID=UPI001404E230|nr:alpha-amylase family glycosyl hydrolase [Segetibacter sp. 3557_3]